MKRHGIYLIIAAAFLVSIPTFAAYAQPMPMSKKGPLPKAYPPHHHHHWRHPPRHVHQNYLAPRHIYRPRHQVYRHHPYFAQRYAQPRHHYAAMPFVMQQQMYRKRLRQQAYPFAAGAITTGFAQHQYYRRYQQSQQWQAHRSYRLRNDDDDDDDRNGEYWTNDLGPRPYPYKVLNIR